MQGNKKAEIRGADFRKGNAERIMRRRGTAFPIGGGNYFLDTRSAYSPVRVSIFTKSPSLMKRGTWIS